MAKRPQRKKYTPINKEKYVGDINNIVCRSSWETKFAQFCDYSVDVIAWGSEPFAIPYYSHIENKQRKYFPDFWIETKKGKTVIEIKPYKETIMPKNGNKKRLLEEVFNYNVNQDKWKFARKFCKENGWKFIIMTEYELGIKKR